MFIKANNKIVGDKYLKINSESNLYDNLYNTLNFPYIM